MIYITGDTHREIDITKLNTVKFPKQATMTKNDFVIVAGDFGIGWDNSNEDLYWKNWLTNRNFTTLFVDGNHENYDFLDSLPVSEWNGGKVHFINDSIIHLMRGQVYTIEGNKLFAFGGADSIDKGRRIAGKTWWKREMPSIAEYQEGMINLEKNNWQVDYVITHDCSQNVFEKLMAGLWTKGLTDINMYFQVLEEKLDYRQWYFGHYHDDRQVDQKHRLLYEQVLKL
ncbi:putative phosphoesterase, ICC [Desulfosporosinus acidiphilus SJ4]|uniref:Putative phosphoesterase, ICC n=1 Tax=Desulfosporosinus acidiphilus (strain DSM 22704 / JCM 16185 / SJ4) TaxID=646529 RepID=I4DAD6_DESAJ|nr:metallophosphoesterase family protein [Desulfosporosinus acidiphilus]AFM42760.1 putative phosphoesterase, ICC [Desulfosporosinus acidiphilus SJ4]